MRNAEAEHAGTSGARAPSRTRPFGSAGILTDSLLTLAFLIGATAAGKLYYAERLRQGPAPGFYQSTYGPAVMLACGRGFVAPVPDPGTPLADFLDLKTDTIRCGDLSPGLTTTGTDGFQEANSYLMRTVGFYWRIFGVGWSVLALFFGLLYGASTAILYVLFRTSLNPLYSIVTVAVAATSPLNIIILPYLRNYAKVPFTTALTLILVCMVMRGTKPQVLALLSLAYAAILAVGTGFRTDLFIYLLPFLPAVLLSPILPLRRRMALAAGCAMIAGGVFMALASPIIKTHRAGNNDWHVLILGLAESFDSALGVNRSVYDYGAQDEDLSVFAQVNAREARLSGAAQTGYRSREYAAACRRYFFSIMRNTPADFLIRSFASVVRVAELPWKSAAYGNRHPLIRFRNRLLLPFSILAAPAIAIAFVMICVHSVRLGLFFGGVFLLLASYPSLQFDVRHAFHLEFAGWWALAFVLQVSWRGLKKRRKATSDRPSPGALPGRMLQRKSIRSFARVAILPVIAGFLVLVVLPLSRRWQQKNLVELFNACLAAPRESLPLIHNADDPRAGLVVPQLGDELRRAGRIPNLFYAEYLAAEFDCARCGDGPRVMMVRNSVPEGINRLDLSRRISLGSSAPSSGKHTVLFPVVFSRSSLAAPYDLRDFQGVEFSESLYPCLAGVYRISDLKDVPICVTVSLPPRWQSLPLYQTLSARSWGSFSEELP